MMQFIAVYNASHKMLEDMNVRELQLVYMSKDYALVLKKLPFFKLALKSESSLCTLDETVLHNCRTIVDVAWQRMSETTHFIKVLPIKHSLGFSSIQVSHAIYQMHDSHFAVRVISHVSAKVSMVLMKVIYVFLTLLDSNIPSTR